MKKKIDSRLRVVEASAQAALILALVLAPYGGRAFDARFVGVLLGMLVGLTLAVYALHAVTFDYFRLTAPGARKDPWQDEADRSLPATQRTERVPVTTAGRPSA